MKTKAKAKKALKHVIDRLADTDLSAKEVAKLVPVASILHYIATAKKA